MSAATDDNFRWRGLRILLAVSTIPIVVVTILRIHHCWSNDAYIDHASGVWIALANDLCHGVFYRPLSGPLGYGGTRYFPLVFVLQAVLMKLGGDPIVMGHLLSLAATLALMAGVYVLLRRLGVDRLLAFCSSVFVLCSESTQLALLSIRGDVLPAALVIWGLVACCGPAIGTRQLIVAAVLFTLAFSAKITAAYALGAAFLFFLLSGRRRQAWTLAGLVALGFSTVVAVMLIASHGRALEVLKACILGGEGVTSLLRTPQRLALYSGALDVGGYLFLVLAAAVLLACPVRFWKDIVPLFFLCTGATTLIIFGSPGVVYNHLINLHCAAIILLAVWISRSDQTRALPGLAFLAIAAVLSIFPAGRNLHSGDDIVPRRSDFQAALLIAKDNRQPILAENPLVPILAGQSPYVLDPFMFRVLSQRNPHFADPLWKKLQQKEFSEVVLEDDPSTKSGRRWYLKVHFGNGFLQKVLDNYTLSQAMNGEYIFLPRQR
jgi:hypothetical protein